MKKAIFILIALFIVVWGAGCASKDEANAANIPSDPQGGNINKDMPNATESSQPVPVTVTPENAQISDSISNETALQEVPLTEAVQQDNGSMMPADGFGGAIEIKPRNISPEISAIKIVSNDPKISVEKMVFVDNRDYEGSTDWDVNEQLKNNGTHPIYLSVYYGEPDNDPGSANGYYYVLKPGDSVWINDTFIDTQFDYNLTNLPTYHIVSHRMEWPEISPEFSNFKIENIRHHRLTYQPEGYSYVDIRSIKYVVKNAEKGWASLVAVVSSGGEDAKATLRFEDVNGNAVSYGGEYWVTGLHVPAGQTVEVELPIREGDSPDDFGGVEIYSYKWR